MCLLVLLTELTYRSALYPQKCFLTYTGKNGKISNTKQGQGWTIEGLMAFKKNLKRVKAERKHLTAAFDKKLYEYCKAMCLPTKKAPKARNGKQDENVLRRSELSVGVEDVSSDSEISTNINKEGDNEEEDKDDEEDEEDNGHEKVNDNDQGKGDDNEDDGEVQGDDNGDDNGDSKKPGEEGEGEGDTVREVVNDDKKNDDDEEEPRHVFTQRRKRRRTTRRRV